MNKNPIGIIDSGVGGLTIASVVIKKLPQESIIYFADSKNVPYGEKSEKEIYLLTQKMVNFLISKNIKLLLIACNTITVSVIEKLRKDYPKLPIVGIVPVIKTAVKKTQNKNIGIYSTLITSKSKHTKSLIKKYAKNINVINKGSGNLAASIENLELKQQDKILQKDLKTFKKNNIDVLVLGCSHFPLVKKKIKHYLPNVLILDSSFAVLRQVKNILINNNVVSKNVNPKYNFYTTGNIEIFANFVNKLTKVKNIERILLP